MPGLPKKYAKMGFARGWKAFKKVKNKLNRTKTKPKQGAAQMPAKKTTTKKTVSVAKKSASKPRAKKRSVTLIPKSLLDAAKMGLQIAPPVLLGPFAVKSLPFIKTQKTWVKSVTLLGLGLITAWFGKKPWMKRIGIGTMVGGGAVWAIEKYPMLSLGAGRKLNAAEIAKLQTMGNPIPINRSMGKPMPINTTMGKSIQITPPMGRSSYRGRRATR